MNTAEKSALEAHLKGIVLSLPEMPGCYQYLDADGTVIYVGKAKNLKNRVSSYFIKNQQSAKTALLVSKIRDIKYIVVRTEWDALLLENNLIKRHKPRYNILLKDDKTYPSIAVTNEEFPRIFKVRQRGKGATFFGPYSHIPTLHALLDLCRELYHPRPCRLPLTEEKIREGKYAPCLEFHIKNCPAPCIGRQSREDYLKGIEACKEVLKGNTRELIARLRGEMLALAEEMRFEEAQGVKERIIALENHQARSEVVSNMQHDIDVFAIEADATNAYINFIHVTKGSITQTFTFEYKKKLDETDEELLTSGIIEMRNRFGSTAREIVVPFPVGIPEDIAEVTIPQRGEKKRLLALSELNVKQYKFDRLKQADKLNPEQKQVRMMQEIRQALQLEKLPMRIELFDNSHLQGENAVAACVVFEKLKPCKKDYRKYILEHATGNDDYASMREVTHRRYSRLRDEGQPLPDLIIADGGKGQMEVIRQVVEDELGLHIPIAGLAKDDRHRTRELLFGNPPLSVGMKPDSPLFRLLTQMQDEVHRFAITFHREKRTKSQTASALDAIPGIGAKTRTALLKEYGSLKRLLAADLQQLQASLGKVRGEKLHAALQGLRKGK